ncbi:Permease [Staphylococcus piscifermentans]|uniref:Uncharacterized protein n=1 Tax=Staphylococcus piscifermentans TaxID=70258 RepID=A0A239TMJ3_9STAP|nr:DUF3147 family protein [Staphylococcus piscifermentans]RTX84107.1 DUF3147 family protein [Staphylococcus piscifermentans]GEP84447.1 hypothetical protein SPI02_10320 [Staphylococcus piscifermentans]SNU99141.1 Permease [Staphylococcus piscifermentans]
MFGISFASLAIRFVFGGLAVALATVIASKLGGKLGGIFSTFPAVYLAALVTLAVDFRGQNLVQQSIHLSSGAVIGIIGCILSVAITAYAVRRIGFRRGAVFSVVSWFILSCIILALKHI